MRFVIVVIAVLLLSTACGSDNITAPASNAPIRTVSAVQDGDTVRVTFDVNQPYRIAALWVRIPDWAPVITIDDRMPRKFAFRWKDYYTSGNEAWYSVRIEWGPIGNTQFYAVYKFIPVSDP